MARYAKSGFVACVACRGSDGFVRWAARQKAQMMGCLARAERLALWFRHDSSGVRGVV